MARLQYTLSVDPLGRLLPPDPAMLRTFWFCATGGSSHQWSFRRGPNGEGVYRCGHCGDTCEKRDLKRATDIVD